MVIDQPSSHPAFDEQKDPCVASRRGALSTTKESYAFSVFEAAFKEFGLPRAIRTDNGVPFASPNSLFGLSKLSVWWLRLGIGLGHEPMRR